MIQAWALEQEDSSKRRFDDQDVLVPWRLQKQYQQYLANGDNDAVTSNVRKHGVEIEDSNKSDGSMCETSTEQSEYFKLDL